MAGRHRWNAAASGIDMMTMLMLDQREHERNLRDKALELHQKFQYDAQLKSIEEGYATYDPLSGQIKSVQPMDVGALAEGQSFSRHIAGGTLTQKSPLDIQKEKAAIDLEGQKAIVEREKERRAGGKMRLDALVENQTKLLPAEGGFMGLGAHPPALTPGQEQERRSALADVFGGGQEVSVPKSKSGRPIRQRADGQWEYAD